MARTQQLRPGLLFKVTVQDENFVLRLLDCSMVDRSWRVRLRRADASSFEMSLSEDDIDEGIRDGNLVEVSEPRTAYEITGLPWSVAHTDEVKDSTAIARDRERQIIDSHYGARYCCTIHGVNFRLGGSCSGCEDLGAPIDRLDVEYDRVPLRMLLQLDEQLRRDAFDDREPRRKYFTERQRLAIALHWSLELGKKQRAARELERAREPTIVVDADW